MRTGMRRLARLEDKIALPALLAHEQAERQRRLAEEPVLEQFCNLLNAALPALSEQERQRLLPAAGATELGLDWPLRRWLDSVLDGSSRLPDSLAPETTCALVRAWLQPGQTSWHHVCLGCGLSRPHQDTKDLPWKVLPGKVPLQGPPPWYDRPDFFQNCPHCGSCEATWAHLNRPEPSQPERALPS